MTLPAPSAIRLLRPSKLGRARLPPPLLGLSSWSDDPNAALVVVSSEDESVDALLPDAAMLPPGTLAILPSEVATRGGLLARLRGPARVSREARAGALLAHGYVDVAAEGDLVWGRA